jgi:uncharacterized protein YceH (UPF0502 family)
VEPDAVEIRVLGSLIEKQRATPGAYPLTLNALRLACNQSTNRDPVVDYDESEIRSALDRLGEKGWTKLASWSTSRAVKYKHVLDQALNLPAGAVSLLALLMLRGPQTPGELKQRSERLHRFESPTEVRETLEELANRDLVESLARRPGQREERYRQLLGGSRENAAPAPAVAGEAEPPADEPLESRVSELERRVAALEAERASE